MNEKEFNLIDEPWIRVMENDCEIKEVSLMDAIVNAHRYKALGGEIPTQDIAVMRVILAVLHTVFSRYDENGEQSELDEDEYEAESRWKALWEKGCFPENAVREYLEEWHERFWLFHPQRPFFQVAGMKSGTDYYSSKLNGEVSESSNKVRIFSAYSGKAKNELTYSQAARWLLYLNAYDDTSSKPTKEGKAKAGGKLPSVGAGWLGKLGLIFNVGNNLFETLMLNLVAVNGSDIQVNQNPLWEHEEISSDERTEIPFPDNLAELYTMQSRRISLIRKGSAVVSYKLIGGDFFQKENAFFEPMTVWRKSKEIEGQYTPKRHDSSRQMWRDFSALYNSEENHCAGVINWYKQHICGDKLIDEKYILKTQIVSVEYGDKDFFVKNVFSDSLAMHSEILSELGEGWIDNIETEIKKCDDAAYAISLFAAELYLASGGKKEDKTYKQIQQDAKTKLYYNFDMPFRNWLYSIDPGKDDKQDKISEWHKSARQIAYRCMHEFADNAPETALTGKRFDNKLYSLPKAINIFRGMINKIYKKEGDKNGK